MFDVLQDQRMHSGLVQELLQISRNRLRYWETKGIITPTFRQHGMRRWREYDAGTVEKIRRIMDLLAEGLTLDGAVKKLPLLAALETEMGASDPRPSNADKDDPAKNSNGPPLIYSDWNALFPSVLEKPGQETE